VVVTADRVERDVARTTSTVTVIDGAALRAAGIVQLGDALRLVPGLQLVRAGAQGAQTSLFLRGGESDYVRVLVDGVPMNDPGGALDLGAFTVDHIDRIEVVRGPGSVLYGSDAVSGVIQVFTRPARARLESRASVRAGSYGSRDADLVVGTRHRGAGVSLGLARHRGDGILPFNNAFRNDVASLRGDGAWGGVTSRIALRHSDNAYQYPTDGAGRVVDRNARRADRRFSASGEWSAPVGARTEAIVSAGALELHGRTGDPPDGPADTLGFVSYRSLGAVRRRGVDARVVFRPVDGHLVAVGGEYAGERQRSADSSNYDLSVNRFAASRLTRSAYAQYLGDVGRVSASVGGRYDDNDVYGAFRTARVSMAVALWAGARLRGGMGTSFKAPTFLETFSTAFSVGNPALVPERSRGWEAGFEQSVASRRLQLAVTGWDQQFRDLIQYTYVSPAEPNYFNVAAASTRGVEVEVRGDTPRGVAWWGTATALRTRVDDAGFQSGAGDTFVRGQRLLRRAPLSLGAGVRVHRWSRASLEASFLHVGQRDDRDFSGFPATPVELDAYARFDLGGEIRLTPTRQGPAATALTFRVDNVAGAGYEEVANFRAPGRVAQLGIRVGVLR